MLTRKDNMTLFIAPTDVEMKIAQIVTDEKTKKHLLNLGLCVGRDIKVLSHTSQDVIVKVMDFNLALNKETALKIIVN